MTAPRLFLFPLKEFNCNSRTDKSYSRHNNNGKGCIFQRQTEEGSLHQLNTLCQRKDTHNLLHSGGHDLNGKGCAGEDQHWEVQNTGDHTCTLRVFCNSANHHPDAQRGYHCQKPASQKSKYGAVSNDFCHFRSFVCFHKFHV